MQAVTQVPLEEFKKAFGEKVFTSSLQMASTLKAYLEKGEGFTGKIIFTVNCRHGGIGSIDAYVQKKIDKDLASKLS